MALVHIAQVCRRRVWSAAGAIAIAAAIVTLAVSGPGGRSGVQARAQEVRSIGPTETGLAASAPRSAAVALARLLPTSGLISVGARPGARVVEIKVKEGDEVAAGALLAVLEGYDAARSQVNLAESRKKRAEEEWSARLDAARKAAELAIPRRDKAKRLYDEFAGTMKGKERYDADMALYQVQMEAIKAELELSLLGGTTTESSGGAAQKVRPAPHNPEAATLDAQVALAEAALRDAEIRATAAGRVLRVLVHPGELSSGPLLEMGDVSSMSARVEVYRTDVPRIRPGDPAEVDILGTRVGGKVTRIGSIVGRNQLTSIDPRALRDLRIVEVMIQLDRAEPAARFVDMEVDAVIRPSGTSPAPEARDSANADRPSK